MSWFKVDDVVPSHPKFLALSDGAFRLWVDGGCYCTRHLTDGHLALAVLATLTRHTARRAAELVAQRLWESDGAGGYRLHDYLDWNPSAVAAKTHKVENRERNRRWRDASRARVSDASRDGARDASHTHSGDASRDASPGMGLDRKDLDLSSSRDPEGEPERKPPARLVADRRLFLHRWQRDALIAILGPYSDDFGLDAWLDALHARLAGVALPADPWKFVQAELHAEMGRRGFSVAEPAPGAPENKRIAGLMRGTAAFLASQKGE